MGPSVHPYDLNELAALHEAEGALWLAGDTPGEPVTPHVAGRALLSRTGATSYLDEGDGDDSAAPATAPRLSSLVAGNDGEAVVRQVRSHRRRSDTDRLEVLWRAKYVIVAAAVIMATLVYMASSAARPVYSSSASLSVTAASTPGGSAQDVALASNDLAAQDAQLVTADGVLTSAAKSLGVPPSVLSAGVTAGTLNAQNVIQITVQAPTPSQAQRRANGIALALRSFLLTRARTSSSALQSSVAAQAAPLDQQIAALRQAIDTVSAAAPGSLALAEVQSEEGQLTQLMASRASLTVSAALAIASQQPNIVVFQAAGPGTKISPRPTFYASLAALATLFIAGQLAIVAARRKTNSTAGS
jgi:capsular polysaccharide biosynthesis protein